MSQERYSTLGFDSGCGAGTRAVCEYLRPFGFVTPEKPRVSRTLRVSPALQEWVVHSEHSTQGHSTT